MRELAEMSTSAADWQVRAFASTAVAEDLMTKHQLGAELRVLSQALATIPKGASDIDAAIGAIQDTRGEALMMSYDPQGSVQAFTDAEAALDHQDYPRANSGTAFTLVSIAVRSGDEDLARKLWAIYHKMSLSPGQELMAGADITLCTRIRTRLAPRRRS